jgi:hypothetical protein
MCGMPIDDLDVLAETRDSMNCQTCQMVEDAAEYAQAYQRTYPNVDDATAAAIAQAHLIDLNRGAY